MARCQWLTPVILATEQANISRTAVRSQSRQIVRETLSQKKKKQKQKNKPSEKRAGRVLKM
jgi:hypothetical protein